MNLAQRCRKALVITLFSVGCLIPGTLPAVTLNFSATLVEHTCSIELDKSTLSLDDISVSKLRPSQLIEAKPFTLSVSNCIGVPGGVKRPSIFINGAGVTQDAKWLFREAGSAAKAGIMVFQSDTSPTYSQTEVRRGNVIHLAGPGEVSVDQSLTFYAAASCGGVTGCTGVGMGPVTAIVSFTFIYQ